MNYAIEKRITRIILRSIGIATCLWAMTITPAISEESFNSAEQLQESVQQLEQRVRSLETETVPTESGEKWYHRLRIGGAVEVECIYDRIDTNDATQEDQTESTVDLAAVDLVIDAAIAEQVEAHLLISYEDDELFVDEGFITLGSSDSFSAYMVAGRQYVPFGIYETFFVTDPTTVDLGETSAGALVVGYRFWDQRINASAGAFNGQAQTEDDDDIIDSFVLGITIEPVQDLVFGVSYTSNLASSDALNTVVIDPNNLDSRVGGWSAFASWALFERLILIGEYVAAVDEFSAGELYDPLDTESRRPAAWNTEVNIGVLDNLEVALRYGGSSDGDGGAGEFLPQTELGAVVNWQCFTRTNLALEYLHRGFQNDYQTSDTFTTHLAVEF